ncbi:MAG: hypothetical protein M1819_000084 [Sarea resinae]|nr:MAG: hypothetical protein M1819_000084 [Sarea resinae]
MGKSFETPLLRVSRPVSACSRCRLAKVKCDGKLPACTACVKAKKGDECSSANDQFAKGKERSYVASLEARIDKLEKRLAQSRVRKTSVTMLDAESLLVKPLEYTAPPSLTSPPRGKAALRREASDVDELVSDFGFLAVNATARDFYGFTSIMSYARLILAASIKEELPTVRMQTLPPRHEVSPLLQYYLDNIFVLIPIICETALYASVEAVYHDAGRRASASDHWILRLVLAITAASLSQKKGDQNYQRAVGHVAAALDKAEDVLHPGSIAGIQAILLLVQYAMLDPHHFDSWTLIGAASRAMVDLGLHEDPSLEVKMSKGQLELRRRTYYSVYTLDRSISMAYARPFSFSDESTSVVLPCQSISPSGLSPKSQLGLQPIDSAVHLFRMRVIQSSLYQDLFKSGRKALVDPVPYIQRIYAEMTQWYRSLPEDLPDPIKKYFQVEILYSYIYTLGPSGKIPNLDDRGQLLFLDHCVEYSDTFLAILKSSQDNRLYTFHDQLRAFMVSRHLLDLVWHNQDHIFSASGALVEPRAPDAPSLPHVPNRSPAENVARAIRAINQLVEILRLLGSKYDYLSIAERYEQDSSLLLADLYQKQNLLAQSSAAGMRNAGGGADQAMYGSASTSGHGYSNDHSHGYNPQDLGLKSALRQEFEGYGMRGGGAGTSGNTSTTHNNVGPSRLPPRGVGNFSMRPPPR